MKKALLLVAALFCTVAITASAADEPVKKKAMTPEQKAFRKEMMTKYDTNGDKKIDKEEAAKITDADKAKMKEEGVSITPAGRKKAQ